jgi:hypothetical protein
MSFVRECKTKSLQDELLATAVVTITGYFYRVDFCNADDLRASLSAMTHRVSKEKRCTCYRSASCPAVSAVTAYLKAGGERAPDPPPGFYPVSPASCPICSAPTVFDHRLSSKQRGAGWRCTQGGSLHYWEDQVQVLKQRFAENPWLFPPVVIRDGTRILAYDGILDGDKVLYPGVLRAEIVTNPDNE